MEGKLDANLDNFDARDEVIGDPAHKATRQALSEDTPNRTAKPRRGARDEASLSTQEGESRYHCLSLVRSLGSRNLEMMSSGIGSGSCRHRNGVRTSKQRDQAANDDHLDEG
jgi:hypothetical protein